MNKFDDTLRPKKFVKEYKEYEKCCLNMRKSIDTAIREMGKNRKYSCYVNIYSTKDSIVDKMVEELENLGWETKVSEVTSGGRMNETEYHQTLTISIPLTL